MSGDFNHGIVHEVSHRPWAMPTRPWLMTQTWRELLFAHWSVDVSVLASLVPPVFPLDLFEGRAWLGIVPFRMTNVAPRFVPALPGISAFPELNVRTYVTVGGKPGVYFFSLDAGSRVAVRAARMLLNLPYFAADMHVDVRDGRIRYSSRRLPRRDVASGEVAAELLVEYEACGPSFEPRPGSLEYFLTERYCLYALDHRARPYRLEIHHPPWPLQPARARFERETMAAAAGIALSAVEPLLHFAARQDMVAWAPERL